MVTENLYHEDQFSDEVKKSIVISLIEGNIIKVVFYSLYEDELRAVEQAKWIAYCFYEILSTNPNVDMNLYGDFSSLGIGKHLRWIPRKARKIHSSQVMNSRIHNVSTYGVQNLPFLRVILNFIVNYAKLKNPKTRIKHFATEEEALSWLRESNRDEL